MSSVSPVSHELSVERLLEEAEGLLDPEQLNNVPDEAAQRLLCCALKLYVSKLHENPDLLPFMERHSVSATDAVVTVSRILKQVNLQVFELAMWQTMGTVK